MIIRRLFRVIVLAGATLNPWPVRAQMPGDQLWRVTHETYACINPRATLALTNPDDPRRNDPGWIAFVVSDGQCVPVTPNSPWRLISRQGDLAFAAYAGRTAQPGSFYFRMSDLAGLVPPPATAPDPPAFAASPPAAMDMQTRRPATLPRSAAADPGSPSATQQSARPLPARSPHPPPGLRTTPPVESVAPSPSPDVPSIGAMIGDRAGQRAGAVLAVLVVFGSLATGTNARSPGKLPPSSRLRRSQRFP